MKEQPWFDPYSLQTKYVFFTGKGGVGKTSIASATAIRLAETGNRVLIISTDPASNLDDVFQLKLGAEPLAVPGVNGLFAANLNPEEAARAYRESVVAPYRNVLPDAAITSIEEQLSGACTVEIAAFDEFAKLLATPDVEGRYDHVILDTAPTGHTLRLLNLPMAWSGFLEENTHGSSCLGPLSGLGDKKALYAHTISALADPLQTTMVLVSRPDRAALSEAARASEELEQIGIANQQLVINGVLFHPGDDSAAQAYRGRQDQALAQMPQLLSSLPTYWMCLQPRGLVGVQALKSLFQPYSESPAIIPLVPDEIDEQGLGSLVEDLLKKPHGIILTMGKGGVGKTTVAAAIALGLAEKGVQVHLSTTDPAAHLEFTLGVHQERNNLTISRIEPNVVTEQYRNKIITENTAHLDEEGLALLTEDLASPCTEEIAVFQAFAEVVEKADQGFVVLDTAPTGHTLLLLDAAEAYHREMQRSTGNIPDHVRKLLPRLRNPEETTVVLITLPEATPVLEAERLQDDLHRAGIFPRWWVVNQSWLHVNTGHPVLSSRAQVEKEWVNYVKQIARQEVIVSWQAEEPVGEERLLHLVHL
jgi:arsenite-transporting ATPase